MEQSQNSSRRLILIGVAVAVVVIVVMVVVSLTMLGTVKKETKTAVDKPVAVSVASKNDVDQSLAKLDATIKQAAADQASAKSAINEGTNQIKVGN